MNSWGREGDTVHKSLLMVSCTGNKKPRLPLQTRIRQKRSLSLSTSWISSSPAPWLHFHRRRIKLTKSSFQGDHQNWPRVAFKEITKAQRNSLQILNSPVYLSHSFQLNSIIQMSSFNEFVKRKSDLSVSPWQLKWAGVQVCGFCLYSTLLSFIISRGLL